MYSRYEKDRLMGNIVVFRRKVVSVPPGTAGNHATSPDSKNWPEALDAKFSPNVSSEKSTSWAIFRLHGVSRFTRGSVRTDTRPHPDGYLLVLLADQEFIAGRDLQAETLLDAAYAAFDSQDNLQPNRVARR
jgi:hypothetical protein